MFFVTFLIIFITIFLSVKLSIYADNYSKTSNVSNAIIGGVFLAGVTSLPEFVTCLSSVYLKNTSLAMGDIIGSNLFNIFIICVFDVLFIRKEIFNKTLVSHLKIFIFLTINYLVIIFNSFKIINFSILGIELPSLVIILLYIIYVFTLRKSEDVNNSLQKEIKHVFPKLIFTSIGLVVTSIILTLVVNKISLVYTSFSASMIGAILLGITTSLPEVVTFYTLIKINNYDMAVDDIIGSNIFNLFVLAIGDIFTIGSIYKINDFDSFILLILCLVFNIVGLCQTVRKKSICKFTYLIPSLIVVFLYLFFWFTFIGS